MTTYQIENTRSGLILGTFLATTPAVALDLMAQYAGYDDYADLQRQIPAVAGEIIVTEMGGDDAK